MPANMIPCTPRDFDPRSREGDVFISLSKLSDTLSNIIKHYVIKTGLLLGVMFLIELQPNKR